MYTKYRKKLNTHKENLQFSEAGNFPLKMIDRFLRLFVRTHVFQPKRFPFLVPFFQ